MIIVFFQPLWAKDNVLDAVMGCWTDLNNRTENGLKPLLNDSKQEAVLLGGRPLKQGVYCYTEDSVSFVPATHVDLWSGNSYFSYQNDNGQQITIKCLGRFLLYPLNECVKYEQGRITRDGIFQDIDEDYFKALTSLPQDIEDAQNKKELTTEQAKQTGAIITDDQTRSFFVNTFKKNLDEKISSFHKASDALSAKKIEILMNYLRSHTFPSVVLRKILKSSKNGELPFCVTIAGNSGKKTSIDCGYEHIYGGCRVSEVDLPCMSANAPRVSISELLEAEQTWFFEKLQQCEGRLSEISSLQDLKDEIHKMTQNLQSGTSSINRSGTSSQEVMPH